MHKLNWYNSKVRTYRHEASGYSAKSAWLQTVWSTWLHIFIAVQLAKWYPNCAHIYHIWSTNTWTHYNTASMTSCWQPIWGECWSVLLEPQERSEPLLPVSRLVCVCVSDWACECDWACVCVWATECVCECDWACACVWWATECVCLCVRMCVGVFRRATIPPYFLSSIIPTSLCTYLSSSLSPPHLSLHTLYTDIQHLDLSQNLLLSDWTVIADICSQLHQVEILKLRWELFGSTALHQLRLPLECVHLIPW